MKVMKHSHEQMRVLHQISKRQHFLSQNLIWVLLLVHSMLCMLYTLLLHLKSVFLCIKCVFPDQLESSCRLL